MCDSAISVLFAAPPAEPTSPEYRKICATELERTSAFVSLQSEEDPTIPIIYVVTPTYHRPEMAAELTRLGQTLLLVPRVHWILAEDSKTCSQVLSDFLEKLGLPFTHIASPMPDIYRKLSQAPRGVSNRRAALQWVRDHGADNGVLYFLDDDNAIDIRLFEEMRDTRKVSMWPVGLIGLYSVSSPVLNDRKASMPYIAGHEEDGFLKSLRITLPDIEVKANRCTEILVWHTRNHQKPFEGS
ncbi:Galactosylgalactosylxylosylprotein 3-beta-glucuronosyltransferase S [Armadillidium vulgare]|nr:Galactosylgalactosylxylosylprotein 3-beta-glucuronosyltransferase S [Armadillidium vulgare]